MSTTDSTTEPTTDLENVIVQAGLERTYMNVLPYPDDDDDDEQPYQCGDVVEFGAYGGRDEARGFLGNEDDCTAPAEVHATLVHTGGWRPDVWYTYLCRKHWDEIVNDPENAVYR